MQISSWPNNIAAFLLGAVLIYSTFWLSWCCRRLRRGDSPTVDITRQESIEPISFTLTILVFLLIFGVGIAMIFLGMAILMALACAFVPLTILAYYQARWRRISLITGLVGAYFQFIFCGVWTLLAVAASVYYKQPTFTGKPPETAAYGFYYGSCIIGFVFLSLWFPWREHVEFNRRTISPQSQ